MVLGSDDERANDKAIADTLPSATSLVCYRHVKNAVICNLQDEVGMNESDRGRVLRLLFGEEGLLHSGDDQTFRQKAEDITKYEQPFTGSEKYTKYMSKVHSNFLEDLILEGIIKPSQKISIEPKWTNNCESINHALKAMLNWKKVDLPSLVQALRTLIKNQEREVEKAMLGVRKY